jgi:release factor glutamine methyltransferase
MIRVKDIVHLFKTELANLYDDSELNRVIAFSFEHVNNFSATDLVVRDEDVLTVNEAMRLHEILEELKLNVPLQYVLGEADFFGMKFQVNEKVLIPRPETEELVEWIFHETKNEKRKTKNEIIDLCTGSGCIAIALKKNILDVSIKATDVSEDALKVARENARMNDVEVLFIRHHILTESFKMVPDKFDIIVSNPPYVSEEEKSSLHDRVIHYEPHLALFVPAHDVLIFYKAIIDFAKLNLKPNGKIYFEINEAKGKEVVALLSANNFSEIELKKDMNGKDRMVKAIFRT